MTYNSRLSLHFLAKTRKINKKVPKTTLRSKANWPEKLNHCKSKISNSLQNYSNQWPQTLSNSKTLSKRVIYKIWSNSLSKNMRPRSLSWSTSKQLYRSKNLRSRDSRWNSVTKKSKFRSKSHWVRAILRNWKFARKNWTKNCVELTLWGFKPKNRRKKCRKIETNSMSKKNFSQQRNKRRCSFSLSLRSRWKGWKN